jgi:hypothetical protein
MDKNVLLSLSAAKKKKKMAWDKNWRQVFWSTRHFVEEGSTNLSGRMIPF